MRAPRDISPRLRTRAVQLGLEGEVISNEETIHYSPVDAAGNPGGFDATSYFLPLRVVGQQLWSVLDATVVVERETLIRDVALNPTDFEEARQAALSSEATMVRDTDEGLRYLVTDKETGERVVEEGLDPTRLFVVGGLFYDESQDYPIPLAGVNWLSFDCRGTGGQANVFFPAPILLADLVDPLGLRRPGGADDAADRAEDVLDHVAPVGIHVRNQATAAGAPVSGSEPLAVFGKAMTSRIDSRPSRSATMRSMPKAMPPCGGAP